MAPLHSHDNGHSNGHERSDIPADQNWWSRTSIWSKTAVGILTVLAVVYAGILLIQTYTGAPSTIPVSSPSQHGSSLSTAPDGLAAYADLLARFGHKVDRLYAHLPASVEHAGNGAGTLVVASPARWNESNSAAVRRFVVKGGTAVLAGNFLNTSTIEGLLGLRGATSTVAGQDPGTAPLLPSRIVDGAVQPTTLATSTTGGSDTQPAGAPNRGSSSPTQSIPPARSVPRLKSFGPCASQYYPSPATSSFTAGVRKVEPVADSACFSTPGSFSEMLVNGNSILGLWKRMGQGSLVLMASSSPLQNAMISEDDNAALAVNLAGHPRSTVAFDEAVHPITPIKQKGLGAIPLRWKVALVLGLLAALAAIWSAGKRLGPVSPPDRTLAPARSGYVDAMATNLSKLHPISDVVDLLQKEGKTRLRHRFSIPTDTGDSSLSAVARQAGVPDYVLEGLYTSAHKKSALIPAGRALAWTANTGASQDKLQDNRKDKNERGS